METEKKISCLRALTSTVITEEATPQKEKMMEAKSSYRPVRPDLIAFTYDNQIKYINSIEKGSEVQTRELFKSRIAVEKMV